MVQMALVCQYYAVWLTKLLKSTAAAGLVPFVVMSLQLRWLLSRLMDKEGVRMLDAIAAADMCRGRLQLCALVLPLVSAACCSGSALLLRNANLRSSSKTGLLYRSKELV
jgi:hypothetical protein